MYNSFVAPGMQLPISTAQEGTTMSREEVRLTSLASCAG
jgi:hypothetical protein